MNSWDRDWSAVRRNWEAWWAGELGRPILSFTQPGPAVPGWRSFTACYPESMSPEEVIELETQRLNGCRFLGDALPQFFPNFGPGSLAACVGGVGRTAETTVWFEPGAWAGVEPEAMQLRFLPASPWARRITELGRAAAERWHGSVVLTPPDLGGATDVLASQRGTEALILDLDDRPETIQRLLDELHQAWWEAWANWREAIGEGACGYGSWAGIFSEQGTYMFQADFSYLLSPELFAEFALPELSRSFARLPHSFYHLDGIGELPHLDRLLADPALAGVQWVPGAGQAPLQEWDEVLNRIADSGKKLQLIGSGEQVMAALPLIRKQEAVAACCAWLRPEEVAGAEQVLRRYGVPVTA